MPFSDLKLFTCIHQETCHKPSPFTLLSSPLRGRGYKVRGIFYFTDSPAVCLPRYGAKGL